MTAKNFNIKNGLSVGGVEVINSSGDLVAGGVGTAVQEAIADKIGGIIQGSGSTTVTYDDTADTITISSTGKTTEEIQDIVGGMMSGNTESGITVAYEDADGTVDFTVSLSSFDTDALSEGSSNLYYTDTRADARVQNAIVDSDTFSGATSTNVPSAESTKAYVDAQTTDETAEGSNNLYFTDARVMTSLATVDAHILPTADVTYDLGSTTKMWRDIYVGPGSLYVNGQQVVSDNSGTITVSADANQNVSVQTSGSGDIELDATGTGNLQIKSQLLRQPVDNTQFTTDTTTGNLQIIDYNKIAEIGDDTDGAETGLYQYVLDKIAETLGDQETYDSDGNVVVPATNVYQGYL